MTERYVVEYDENHCAWLVRLGDNRRIALEHGMLLDIAVIQHTSFHIMDPADEPHAPGALCSRRDAASRA
jgi:hypothetical protein